MGKQKQECKNQQQKKDCFKSNIDPYASYRFEIWEFKNGEVKTYTLEEYNANNKR